jgi:hypothetical protein
MISNTRCTVNTLLRFVSSLVLCTGFTYPHISRAETDASTTSKAQLHVPWKLLSERLEKLVNRQSGGVAQPIEAQTLNADGIIWQLNAGRASATLAVDDSTIRERTVQVAVTKAKLQIELDQITVDQVIEREIGGVRVRVHLNAVCGPIIVNQAEASANSSFNLDWSGGSPKASLAQLDLGWAPNSWTFNQFECTGPSGLDVELREGISNYLRDPATFKPYVERYIAENLKAQVDEALAELRSPLKVGTGSDSVALVVGALEPVSTGVIADITLAPSGKSRPKATPAKALPSERALATLSRSQPSLLGDIDLIEFAIQQKLRSQGQYYKLNLQEVEGFRKLMHSRIAQLFKWAELMNYPENNPFYLNLANPKSLSLRKGSGSALTSAVPIYALTQSYRSKKWWNWIITRGTANTSVDLTLSNGKLKYTTEITSASLKSQYAPEYAKKYDKDEDNKIPDKIFAEAIAGPQSALSGEFQFPDVDLDESGEYRASELKWIDSKNFRLEFIRRR